MPAPTLSVKLDLSSIEAAQHELDRFIAENGPKIEALAASVHSALAPEGDKARPLAQLAEDIDRGAQAVRRFSPEVERFVNFTGRQMGRLSTGITQTLWGERANFTRIFRAMAQDFVTYFVDAVLSSVATKLVTGLLRLLRLFDVSENDAMIEREGARAGALFARGFLRAAESLSFTAGGALSAEAIPAPGLSVHVHNATPETWVEVVDRYVEPRLRRNRESQGRGYRLSAYTEDD